MNNRILGVLVFSVFFLSLPAVHSQEIFRVKEGVYSTNSITTTMRNISGNKVNIESASTLWGKLSIATSAKNEIKITYYKTAKTDSKSTAIDYIDLIAVELHKVAGGVRLQMRASNPAPWSGTNESAWVEAELTVPEHTSLDIDAQYFRIDANGPFSEVIVAPSLERIDIADVTGRLDVQTANQRVSIADITGDISVSTSHAALDAYNIVSDDKQAVFRNEYGDITIDGFIGELNVKTSYGRIDISGYQPLRKRNIIRGQYGPVSVDINRITDAQVVIANRFEDIDLGLPADISAMLTLAVSEDSKIEVSNLLFQTDLVEQNRLSLIAGSGDATIRGTIRGKGNIYVRGMENK